jgi:hypothetical protein
MRPALAVEVQVDSVGGVRTDHCIETPRDFFGELPVVDEKPDLGVDPPGALVIVHGSDVEALPIHHVELGVQTVGSVT